MIDVDEERKNERNGCRGSLDGKIDVDEEKKKDRMELAGVESTMTLAEGRKEARFSSR